MILLLTARWKVKVLSTWLEIHNQTATIARISLGRGARHIADTKAVHGSLDRLICWSMIVCIGSSPAAQAGNAWVHEVHRDLLEGGDGFFDLSSSMGRRPAWPQLVGTPLPCEPAPANRDADTSTNLTFSCRAGGCRSNVGEPMACCPLWRDHYFRFCRSVCASLPGPSTQQCQCTSDQEELSIPVDE